MTKKIKPFMPSVSEQDVVIGEGPEQFVAARLMLITNPFIMDEAKADVFLDECTYRLATLLKNEFNKLEKTKV